MATTGRLTDDDATTIAILSEFMTMNSKGVVAKAVKKRSRVSKKTPTTHLNANTSNFRAIVQQFTGCPKSSLPFSYGQKKGPITLNFGDCGDQELHRRPQQQQPLVSSRQETCCHQLDQHQHEQEQAMDHVRNQDQLRDMVSSVLSSESFVDDVLFPNIVDSPIEVYDNFIAVNNGYSSSCGYSLWDY